MARFNTCRFCDNWRDQGLVKYGARHYAHYRCYLDAGKPLSALPKWQVGEFPYFLLKERDEQQESEMAYRVVYGETMPAWEQIFPTMREAKAFAKEHEGFGDVIFSVRKVIPGEPPQSLTAAIDAERVAQ